MLEAGTLFPHGQKVCVLFAVVIIIIFICIFLQLYPQNKELSNIFWTNGIDKSDSGIGIYLTAIKYKPVLKVHIYIEKDS